MIKPYLYIFIALLSINFLGCQPDTNKYNNIIDCNSDCQTKGFDQGNCLLPYKTSRDMTNIGACQIENNSSCSQPNQCQCYCFDNNMIEESLEIINKQSQ